MAKPVAEVRFEVSSSEAWESRKDLGQPWAELTSKWWIADLRAKQAAGKPVYLLGRLVTTPI